MALSPTEVRSAVQFNIRRSFEVELIRRMQRTVAVAPDGIFGAVTVQAIANFQEAHGLLVDGKVGPLTLTALQRAWQEQGEAWLSPNEIQRALRYNRARGYAPVLVSRMQETVDAAASGEFDAATVLAIAIWQSHHDLIADGSVGPNTLRAFEAAWAASDDSRTVYRIHPGIGVARVGDSPTEFFIGPESPGRVAPEEPVHRDAHGFIKRQGARFRVYAYRYDPSGRLLETYEVTSRHAQIHWTVHLANRKAVAANFPPTAGGGRRNAGVDELSLIIDAGAQSLSGAERQLPLQGAFLGSAVRLGELRTDADGRLVVLGGHGVSRSPSNRPIGNFANNDGWHDDVSDGPVRAQVVLANGETSEAEPAWVLVAAPRYAPEIDNVTTFWDQAFELATRLDTTLVVTQVSFTQHIYPILARASKLAWVSASARAGHGPGKPWDFLAPALLARLASASPEDRSVRERVYQSLRQSNGSGRNMPLLNTGVDPNLPEQSRPSTLTDTQLRWLEQWALGAFAADFVGEPVPVEFAALPIAEQPAALDRAALASCIGGPFFPGIEAGYVIARADTYGSPFRIAQHHGPGYLTAGLAVPWQADFYACGERWWPAQRPVNVYREGSETPGPWVHDLEMPEMVSAWADLGFIRKSGERYVERERQEPDLNT